MDKEDGSTAYDLLDTFGSDVGSTLDDLVSSWDTPDHYDGRKAETENMEDVGKRLAKPLYFYNPVYRMANSNKDGHVVMRRPSLIPISQLNQNPKETNLRERTDSKEKKKHHGLFSKLAGIGRRQSKGIIEKYPSSHESTNMEESIMEESSFVRDEEPPKANLQVKNSPAPQKPVRHSLFGEQDNQTKAQENRPVPSPRKNPPSPAKQDEETLQTSEDALVSKIRGDEGSSSFSSTQSDDGSVSSDSVVTTMAEVMSEIDQDLAAASLSVPKADDSVAQEENGKPLLKRNKTLKWSGSRRAPALLREFTRRQKNRNLGFDNDDLGSPNKEVESYLLSSTIMNESTSRSSTPSQQTTSFGMEEEGGAKKKDLDVPPSPKEPRIVDNVENTIPPSPSGKHDSAFYTLSSFLPPAPRLRRTQSSKVRAYLSKMGSNVNNALGYAVSQFIEQTKRNKETRPLVLLHDIRSFLTDIKRYLISNPHIGVVKRIQKIINYSSNVDVEGAVDDSLDKLVLYPLHGVIYRCLVVNYTKSGQLKLLEEAIALAKTKSNQELGIRPTLIPPNEECLEIIKEHFIKLQKTYSPYFKLKELLLAVTKIYENTHDLNMEDKSARKIGADDFLPLLVHSIVHCNFVAADIEAQYIDGLLEPNLLLGEGGYYLTTLISALQVVFSIKRKEAALPNISDLQGFLKVGISSVRHKSAAAKGQEAEAEEKDFILHKTLHVPPAMTSNSLGQMISKKFNIQQPEEYCLHVIVNDIAYPLEPNECPQLVKMDLLTQFPATSFFFSFQRKCIKGMMADRPISIVQVDNTLQAEMQDVKTEIENPPEMAAEITTDPPPDAVVCDVTVTAPDISVTADLDQNDVTGNKIDDGVAAELEESTEKEMTIQTPVKDATSEEEPVCDGGEKTKALVEEGIAAQAINTENKPAEEPKEKIIVQDSNPEDTDTKVPSQDDTLSKGLVPEDTCVDVVPPQKAKDIETEVVEKAEQSDKATGTSELDDAIESLLEVDQVSKKKGSQDSIEQARGTVKTEEVEVTGEVLNHTKENDVITSSGSITDASSFQPIVSSPEHTKALPEIQIATNTPQDKQERYGSATNLSKNSSISGSYDDVFAQNLATELFNPHRETVASLKDYFEKRSAQCSPNP